MPRIKPVAVAEAKGEIKEIYQDLEQKMGKVINIFQLMGHSATTLKGFLNLSEAANHTSLPPQLREQIALIVGQANHCQYCLSAHTALAKGLGMNEPDILKARRGESIDLKGQAILQFASLVIEKRGNVTDQNVTDLKAAGVTEAELVDVILVIVVNIFTNYFNLITDPKIDFPQAPELK
jgi:uncharacterized peroxidase-related enzyme